MWKEYNPNPVNNGRAGDCAVRALAKALNVSWETAYAKLVTSGFLMGDLPNANYVIGAVLRENGFKRKSIPDACPECFTVEDFCNKYRDGIYVIFSQDHVATEINGILYDSWNSLQNIPQFFWYKPISYKPQTK